MQDIFISTSLQPISSWKQAFPDSKLVDCIADLTAIHDSKSVAVEDAQHDSQQPMMFWIHINEAARIDLSQAVALIKQHFQLARIVVLDNAPNHETSLKVLGLGVAGYAHAYSAPEVLTEIRAVVSHGGLWLGQQLLQRLIESTRKLTGNNPEQVDKLLKQLTKREREVSLEAAKGLSNKEIARMLNITERTVKAHLAASFERLKVKDRLQLALMLNKQADRQEDQGSAQNDARPAIEKVG
jgi:two-component system nitrate/nitrite response regulator NarL